MQDPRTLSFYRPVQQALITLMFAVLIVGACAALYSARMIVLMLLIGIGLGIVIRPTVDWIKSKGKVGQKIAIPSLLIGLLAVLSGMGELLYILISNQVIPLSRKLPQYLQSLQNRFSGFSSRYHFIPPHIGPQDFGNNIQNAAQATLSALSLSAGLGADLFFILAVCLYFTSAPEEYFNGFLSLFPAHDRPPLAEAMKKSGTAVRLWFTSQFIAMAIVGSILAIALSVIGHPYWYLLGILTGLLELIPFLGPVVALSLGTLITLAAVPDKTIAVLVIYLILLQIEGNVIIPLLMKGRIQLPPIYLLTIMLVFAEWFGVPGLLIATPVLAVVRTVYLNFYVPRMDRMTKPTYLEPVDIQQKRS